MLNYEEVPNNILTGKDLDYLSDMFNWNYGAYKNSVNAIDKVNDVEIKDLLTEEVIELFTTPNELGEFKEAITQCLLKGTKRNVVSEDNTKNVVGE
jgi:hypothetical protein